MGRSFNGWTTLADYPPRSGTYVTPTGKTVYTRNADTAVIFKYVTDWWHENIEPIPASHPRNRAKPYERHGTTPDGKWDPVGVHSWRPPGTTVGTGDQSNHRSATAIDVNGHLHPYEASLPASQRGANYRDGFTPTQRAKLRALARTVTDDAGRSVLRLGIDFAVGLRDGMHVEIAPGVTAAQVRQAADRIRAKTAPARPSWETAAHVKRVQHLLNELTDAGLTVDGKRGPVTDAATLAFQKSDLADGYNLTADGAPGPATLSALEDIMSRLDVIEQKIDENIQWTRQAVNAIIWPRASTITRLKADESAVASEVADKIGPALKEAGSDITAADLARELVKQLTNPEE